jgi:phosphoglycerate kinase
MGWKTLDDMDLGGKVVLVRVDINVPVEGGRVTDATRIERIVPTVTDILAKGGGRCCWRISAGPRASVVPEMSLVQLVPALESALGAPVVFAADCVGGVAKQAVAALKEGEVLLLENTRFHAGEEANDPLFAASLWPRWAISIATTRFRPRTGRMPRPRGWRICCPPAPGG